MADPEDYNTVVHPLRLAYFMGMERVVKPLIVDRGANVNVPCMPMMYSNALMWASVRPGNSEIIRLLLENGADVNLRDTKDRRPL